MPPLYDPPPTSSTEHPATFALPRQTRTYRSVGKRRRRGHRPAAYSSSDSDGGSSSGGEEGSRAYPAAAPAPLCTTNQLLLGTVGIVLLLCVAGYIIYRNREAILPSASSSSSSSSSSPMTAAVTQAKTADKSTTATRTSETASSAAAATKSASATASSAAASSSSGGAGSGLFGVTDATCGDSGAVDEPVAGGGPNGSQEWLNCGLSKDNPDGKWTPPHIDITQLKAASLDDALQLDIFSACKQYESAFQAASDANGIPAVLLVSIAMTESSCNADAKGDNGDAWGLMQILSDKCSGAPSGNCADPTFNVNRGAEYFKNRLDENGGSTLVALGQYNGWYEGLTYNKATAAGKDQSTCVYQNNLDYFQVTLNGYLQGVDGQQLATVKNLAICNDDR